MSSVPLDNRHEPIINGILRAVYRKTTCVVIYKNQDNETKEHTIIPYKYDKGENGAEPRIYAYDVKDRQTKEFLIKGFISFVADGQKKTPPYTQDKNSFQTEFDPSGEYKELVMQDDMDVQMKNLEDNPAKAAKLDERRVIRIANRIMEFSGAEANLFVPGKKSDSYDEVDDDGRG